MIDILTNIGSNMCFYFYLKYVFLIGSIIKHAEYICDVRQQQPLYCNVAIFSWGLRSYICTVYWFSLPDTAPVWDTKF